MKSRWTAIILVIVLLWSIGAGIAHLDGFEPAVTVGILVGALGYGSISYFIVHSDDERGKRFALIFVTILGVLVGVAIILLFQFELYEMVEDIIQQQMKQPTPCTTSRSKPVTCV